VLQRTAVDPQPHCDSPWIPTDRSTHNRGGYRGKWYTPGWPWPFHEGVGVVVGHCTYPRGATSPRQPEECCSVIFGKLKGAKCLETAHHMVLEQTLAEHAADPPDSLAATLPLDAAYAADAAEPTLDAAALRRLARQLTARVVWVDLPPAVASGGALPKIVGLSEQERAAVAELLHDECESLLADGGKGNRGKGNTNTATRMS
jgi:hypothetical protein